MNLNLTPTINLQRPNLKGFCPVRIRSTVKRKVTFYPTGINVLPEQWENKEVIKHPNKILLNRAIRDKIIEIENTYEQTTPVKKIHDFYAHCETKIAQQKSRDSHGTWKHKKSYLNKVRKFKPHLQFAHITPSFMLDFENYCRAQGNKPTTVWSSIKFLKTMVNAARNDGVVTGNPMRGYKAEPYVNPVREYLTDNEIESIEKFSSQTTNPTLKKVADWFLFGCYSSLRYADIKNFDKKKVVDGRIILRTEKFKTDVSIKVHPKLSNVLDRICPNVFANQKMNDYLKIIAVKCDIDKVLTFHCSRHTFAVYWLNHGGDMDTLSKILGHTTTRVTQIYGRITNLRIDAAIDKVFNIKNAGSKRKKTAG